MKNSEYIQYEVFLRNIQAQRRIYWKKGSLFCVFSIIMCVSVMNVHTKFANPDIYKLVNTSNPILVCRNIAVENGVAQIKVLAVLKGSFSQKEMAWPVLMYGDGESLPRPLPPDADFILFRGNKRKNVIPIPPKNLGPSIARIKKLITIAEMDSEYERDLEMFREVSASNSLIRPEAYQYILKISSSALHDSYRTELITLIKSTDTFSKSLAFYAIRFTKDKEFVSLAILATQSKDEGVLESASMVLSEDFSPEATSALINLTRNPSDRIRTRACIDLRDRRHAGALTVITGLLNDPSPKVRATAAMSLSAWHRTKDKEAQGSVPRLIEMLNDKDEEVQISAANSLQEAHDSRAVKPLLKVLQRKTVTERVEGATVDALNAITSPDRFTGFVDKDAVHLVNAQLALFVNILDSHRWGSLYAVSILAKAHTPEAISVLNRVAKDHPNKDVRLSAQWSLTHKQ